MRSLAVFLLGVIVGCAFTGLYFHAHKPALVASSVLLRPGMSMKEAEAAFGSPDKTETEKGHMDGKFEAPEKILWIYTRYKITASGEKYGQPGHITFIPVRFLDSKWTDADDTAQKYGEQSDTFRVYGYSGSFPLNDSDWNKDDSVGKYDGVPLKELKK